MKIRVLSDLHLDVNDRYDFKLRGNRDFTILAGDTSGDPKLSIDWIKKNMKSGIVITGNHLVYNKRGLGIQKLRDELHEAFPLNSDITYFDNNVGVISKEVNGILFVGTCLYTDFKLKSPGNPEGDEAINMAISHRSMNDYRWGHQDVDVNGKEVYAALTPFDYRKWFNESIEAMDKVISDNEKSEKPLPVIVITHHGPTLDCVSSSYVNDTNNASYVSDLTDFIEKHVSIKYWIYGHVHSANGLKIITRKDGSEYVLMNNARGYCGRCEDYDFNPNMFIDTETWKVEVKPLSKSQEAKRKKRWKEFERLSMWFM